MAEIVVHPFTMKDVTLSIGADDYKQHVSRVRFEPTVPQVKWKGLAPTASFTDQGLADWVCNLAIAQDWDDPTSLANYLLDNEGTQVDATFEPVNGGQAFTATIILAPPAIGGDVDTVAAAEVSCGVVGRPEKVVAP